MKKRRRHRSLDPKKKLQGQRQLRKNSSENQMSSARYGFFKGTKETTKSYSLQRHQRASCFFILRHTTSSATSLYFLPSGSSPKRFTKTPLSPYKVDTTEYSFTRGGCTSALAVPRGRLTLPIGIHDNFYRCRYVKHCIPNKATLYFLPSYLKKRNETNQIRGGS